LCFEELTGSHLWQAPDKRLPFVLGAIDFPEYKSQSVVENNNLASQQETVTGSFDCVRLMPHFGSG